MGANQQLKVLLVTPTFPPENGWGGIGTYSMQQAIGLTAAGIEAHVLCGKSSAQTPPRSELRGTIWVHRLLEEDNGANARDEIRAVVERLIHEFGITVVEFPEYDGIGLTFQQHNPGFPTVVRLHGDSEICFQANSPPLKRLINGVIAPKGLGAQVEIERASVQLAHLVTAPTAWTLEQAKRRGWLSTSSRTRIIANPFFGFGGAKPTREPIPEQCGNVVMLGRLDYRKGANLIPAVVNRVGVACPHVNFLIVGQDSQVRDQLGRPQPLHYQDWIKARLKGAIRDKTTFAGGIPYLELPNRLPRDGVACFMSTMETFGYTHVETMELGLATVVASLGGARELGTHGRHLIYARRSPDSIAKALISLLKDDSDRTSIAAAGRSHVHEAFGSDALITDMVAMYRNAQDGIVQ